MALSGALQQSKIARPLWNILPYRVRDEVWKTVNKKAFDVPRQPATFNEKVRYKMLKDRRPLLTTFADKVAVRDYVARKAGRHLLTQLYLVTGDPDRIGPDCLPREFVIKAAHGCGGVAVVADHAAPDARLPEPPAGWSRSLVAPGRVDWAVLRGLCREWLGLRYNPRLEWAYAHVPPRILAEELLTAGGSIPQDYRFFVFHGHVRLVQVESARFGARTCTTFSPDWNYIPVTYDQPSAPGLARPRLLADMITIAQELGQDTDFVRVDLYDLGDRIVFGEMTNYPGAGRLPFDRRFCSEIGAWWSQPRKYR